MGSNCNLWLKRNQIKPNAFSLEFIIYNIYYDPKYKLIGLVIYSKIVYWCWRL